MSLMQVFEFSPADLEANRNGWVTEAQRLKIEAKRRAMTRGVKGTTLAYMLFFPGLMVVAVLVENPKDLLQPAYWVFIGGLLVFLMGALGLSLSLTHWLHRDARRMRIHVAAGVAKTRTRVVHVRMSRFELHELNLGRKRFRFESAGQLAAFQAGERYRVYYVPVAPLEVILSAELA